MTQDICKKQMAWAFYTSQEHRINDSEFRKEALIEAKKIMEEAKRNVDEIINCLIKRDYKFLNSKRVLIRQDDLSPDWLEDLQEKGIFIPISLQAWIEVVGSVNLMGSSPEWDFSGYYYEKSDDSKPIKYTDPLVVEVDRECILSEFENWEYQVKQDGPEEIGPFKIPIAPDDVHKANVSGGAPYEVSGDKACVESHIFNERHGYSFVAYLRNAFDWGGFPGFEIIENYPVEFINEIKNNLIRI